MGILTKKQVILVLELRRSGHSLKAIAKKVKTRADTVKKCLSRLGVYEKQKTGARLEKNGNWKGGRVVTVDGYVKIRVPGRKPAYVPEHRLVMENMIGRLLRPKEVVHHRNGDRADNRPANLQLFSENKFHLAHELTGRRPNWTPEGLARIQKGVNRWRESRRLHNLKASKPGARKSRETSRRSKA